MATILPEAIVFDPYASFLKMNEPGQKQHMATLQKWRIFLLHLWRYYDHVKRPTLVFASLVFTVFHAIKTGKLHGGKEDGFILHQECQMQRS